MSQRLVPSSTTVHGPNARPSLELEALHEPQRTQRTQRFCDPISVLFAYIVVKRGSWPRFTSGLWRSGLPANRFRTESCELREKCPEEGRRCVSLHSQSSTLNWPRHSGLVFVGGPRPSGRFGVALGKRGWEVHGTSGAVSPMRPEVRGPPMHGASGSALISVTRRIPPLPTSGCRRRNQTSQTAAAWRNARALSGQVGMNSWAT